ncbi:hypothetical protein FB45DRAFT_873767 [Roridomyces roridus]|uniref:Uncharacterized protein n=1 Tax=Roridomyces roridus TaxID=1738132 RepID=A0AAD7B9P8_9AGAR|nr:hypothetical protein FB45DRAFT_873767 [Roridomyces roridus]
MARNFSNRQPGLAYGNKYLAFKSSNLWSLPSKRVERRPQESVDLPGMKRRQKRGSLSLRVKSNRRRTSSDAVGEECMSNADANHSGLNIGIGHSWVVLGRLSKVSLLIERSALNNHKGIHSYTVVVRRLPCGEAFDIREWGNPERSLAKYNCSSGAATQSIKRSSYNGVRILRTRCAAKRDAGGHRASVGICSGGMFSREKRSLARIGAQTHIPFISGQKENRTAAGVHESPIDLEIVFFACSFEKERILSNLPSLVEMHIHGRRSPSMRRFPVKKEFFARNRTAVTGVASGRSSWQAVGMPVWAWTMRRTEIGQRLLEPMVREAVNGPIRKGSSPVDQFEFAMLEPSPEKPKKKKKNVQAERSTSAGRIEPPPVLANRKTGYSRRIES